MMFLVLFGSLAAAMAVVAQGNMRAANASLQVNRAMSAAETGLVFAQRRLAKQSKRFIVFKGEIDAGFGEDLWLGTYASDQVEDVLPPDGYEENSEPAGLIHAVRNAHLADTHTITVAPGDDSLPSIDPQSGMLAVRPVALTSDLEQGPYFRLHYALLADEPMVRVTSIGFDDDVTRTLQMDFRIDKKIEYAVVAPNRLMIGKNVLIEGPLGSRYGINPEELANPNGDPLLMKSDFYYLSDDLDDKLDTFFQQVADYDTDGDTRLRPGHPTEGQGVSGISFLVDYDGNEYVDDFDLFLAQFDANGDKKVVYDSDLAQAAGHGSVAVEFSGIDDQMTRLLDESIPDRNGDDVVDADDTGLGYKDGVLDANDVYAKVRGRLMFAVSKTAWEDAQGHPYQDAVHGPVRPGPDEAPISFEVGEDQLREITTDMFSDSAQWFVDQASDNFDSQVSNGSGTYTPAGSADWEEVPYGSEFPYDYFRRPVYEGFTFENVRIPKGNNGLFINCTFKGVTYIGIETDCDHPDWNFAGVLDWSDENDDGIIDCPHTDYDQHDDTCELSLKYPGLAAELNGNPVPDTRVHSNSIRFHDCTFLGSIAGDTPGAYTQVRNKVQLTGMTRFYIDPEDEDLAEQDDAAELIAILESISAEDQDMLKRSSIMMPGWSMDVGSFENVQAADPQDTPRVKLKGTIVSGILDIRGTATVDGTMLMTFRPVAEEGPLTYYTSVHHKFNTTIGYFGPDDGDGEGIGPEHPNFPGFGEIRLRYDPDAKLPDGIPWPISASPEPNTYVEGSL